MSEVIVIEPDEVAVIANRLARRLRAEGVFPENPNRYDQALYNRAVEALADELHQDIIDRMLGKETT